MAEIITSENFDEKVLHSDIPVLVDFFATWCGPCRQMHPIIEELSTEKEGEIAVYQLDIDQSPDIAQRFGVMSVPTFISFEGGEAKHLTVGAQPKQNLLGLFAD